MKQLLYFSAPWCQPCKQFKPVIESLQSEMSITFIDVEISSQTAIQYNVRSVPTIRF
jgi:thioredoxin 1